MNYIVDQSNGNDTTGTPAFKTITAAAFKTIDGDRVTVKPGNYPERVGLTHANNVTFEGLLVANAPTVTMQGFEIVYDKITIDGFEITKTPSTVPSDRQKASGVYLDSKDSTLRNLYIHDVGGPGVFCTKPAGNNSLRNKLLSLRIMSAVECGVYADGIDCLFEGMDISHIRSVANSDADGVRFFGTGNRYRKIKVHDMLLSDSPGQGPHIDAFQTWGPVKDAIFEQCWVDKSASHTQGWTIENLNGTNPVSGVRIWNNVILSRGTGYQPAVNVGDLGPVLDVTIAHNTVVALNGGAEYAFWLFKALNGVQVLNNAVLGYALMARDDGAQNVTRGYNDIQADGFVDMTKLDFHLLATSPLRKKGMIVPEVKKDFDDVTRSTMTPDIGAFEYVSPIVAPPPPPPTLPTVAELFAAVEFDLARLKTGLGL